MRASVTKILQKGKLFFRQILRRRASAWGPWTRKDRGKGLSLILNEWTSSNYSSKTASESLCVHGLLSFLAAALARILDQKYVSKSFRLSVPHFECNVARVSEPRTIFTRNKNDLYHKLIAFQKRDGHTYIQR